MIKADSGTFPCLFSFSSLVICIESNRNNNEMQQIRIKNDFKFHGSVYICVILSYTEHQCNGRFKDVRQFIVNRIHGKLMCNFKRAILLYIFCCFLFVIVI